MKPWGAGLRWAAAAVLGVAFAASVALSPGAVRAEPSRAEPPRAELPRVGTVAPDFLLPALEGAPMRLEDFRGRPLILTFWAFWCDTWKEVHHGFLDLARERGRYDFAMVTVSIDCQWKEQIAPLLAGGRLPYGLLMDPQSRVSRAWGVVAVPTVCVLDRGGMVRARYEGYPGTRRLVEWVHVLARRPRL